MVHPRNRRRDINIDSRVFNIDINIAVSSDWEKMCLGGGARTVAPPTRISGTFGHQTENEPSQGDRSGVAELAADHD